MRSQGTIMATTRGVYNIFLKIQGDGESFTQTFHTIMAGAPIRKQQASRPYPTLLILQGRSRGWAASTSGLVVMVAALVLVISGVTKSLAGWISPDVVENRLFYKTLHVDLFLVEALYML